MPLEKLLIAKMEAHFSQWGERLDAMKVRLEEGELQDRIEFHKQVDASQRQHEQARQHLDEMKQSGEDAWRALKAGVEAALAELSASDDGNPA
jgi:hypothetical protein